MQPSSPRAVARLWTTSETGAPLLPPTSHCMSCAPYLSLSYALFPAFLPSCLPSCLPLAAALRIFPFLTQLACLSISPCSVCLPVYVAAYSAACIAAYLSTSWCLFVSVLRLFPFSTLLACLSPSSHPPDPFLSTSCLPSLAAYLPVYLPTLPPYLSLPVCACCRSLLRF